MVLLIEQMIRCPSDNIIECPDDQNSVTSGSKPAIGSGFGPSSKFPADSTGLAPVAIPGDETIETRRRRHDSLASNALTPNAFTRQASSFGHHAWLAIAILLFVLYAELAMPSVLQSLHAPSTLLRDWSIFTEAGWRITHGLDPYVAAEPSLGDFKWSPLAAYAFALVAPLGHSLWAAIGIGLWFVADRRMAAIALIAPALWADVLSGVSFLFIPPIAILALRGSKAASLAWVSIAVLIPRPLMVPILVWLIWTRPGIRLPATLIVLGVILGSMATGWGDEWIGHLAHVANHGDPGGLLLWPSAFWPLGVGAAVWLARRGFMGLASLAVSPYLLPSYFLMALVDAVRLVAPTGKAAR